MKRLANIPDEATPVHDQAAREIIIKEMKDAARFLIALDANVSAGAVVAGIALIEDLQRQLERRDGDLGRLFVSEGKPA